MKRKSESVIPIEVKRTPNPYFDDVKFGDFKLHYGTQHTSVCSKAVLYQKSLFIRNFLESTPDLCELHIDLFDHRTIGSVLTMITYDISPTINSNNYIEFEHILFTYGDILKIIRFCDYFGINKSYKQNIQELVKKQITSFKTLDIKDIANACISCLEMGINDFIINNYIDTGTHSDIYTIIRYLILKHASITWIQTNIDPKMVISFGPKNSITMYKRCDDDYKLKLFRASVCRSSKFRDVGIKYENIRL